MAEIDKLKNKLYESIHNLEHAIVKKIVEASSDDNFLLKQHNGDLKEENNTLRNNLFQLEKTLTLLKNQNKDIKDDVDSLIHKLEKIIEKQKCQ
jgi:regulator of replication initiation timing